MLVVGDSKTRAKTAPPDTTNTPIRQWMKCPWDVRRLVWWWGPLTAVTTLCACRCTSRLWLRVFSSETVTMAPTAQLSRLGNWWGRAMWSQCPSARTLLQALASLRVLKSPPSVHMLSMCTTGHCLAMDLITAVQLLKKKLRSQVHFFLLLISSK